MRNLAQYPITEGEILLALCKVIAEEGERTKDEIGAMTPILLTAAMEIVVAAGAMLRAIDQRFDKNPGSVLRYATPWKEATQMLEAFRKRDPENIEPRDELLSSGAQEVMRCLFFNGPTWDGDIPDKQGRGELSRRNLATRYDGYTTLTAEGLRCARDMGLYSEKEKRKLYQGTR